VTELGGIAVRTEIAKAYDWGFVLSEQDLRRIIQTCQEDISKNYKDDHRQNINVKLKNGSIIECQNIDDIFSIENAASKSVEYIKIDFIPNDDTKSEWSISINFQNPFVSRESWNSVNFVVSGDSRDWVFVTTTDIEERIKKTKTTIPYHLLFSKKEEILLVCTIIGATLCVISYYSDINYFQSIALNDLKLRHKEGFLKDGIEAISILEFLLNKYKMEQRLYTIKSLIIFVSPVILGYLLSSLMRWLCPPFNFYWGDNISILDRKRNASKIIWAGLGIGILASLIAGFLYSYLTGKF
jgi:hypothetical protein